MTKLEPSALPLFPGGLRALVGPTASGKSELALAVAERCGAEIVSLDSMQVYRRMDVGTAKPDAAMQRRVPHHMVDLVPPSERYDVQRFLADLRPLLAELEERGARALFVGGTAFYLKVLTHGLFEGPPANLELRERLKQEAAELGNEALHARLAAVDPPSAERLHANDVRRVVRALEVHEETGRALSEWQREWGWRGQGDAAGRERYLVGVGHEAPELDARIECRARRMLEAGWIEEAVAIREDPGFGPTAIQALGYAEVLRHADGELDREECVLEIALRTRQFARRQRTWYRKFPEIRWLVGSPEEDLERLTAEAARALRWEDEAS